MTRVAAYRLVELRQEKTHERVFSAIDERSGAEVELHLQSHGADAVAARRFMRQVEALMRVEHENVVAVIDYGEAEDGSQYIALEPVDGAPLREEARRRRLTPPVVAGLFAQACRGLAALHEARIGHGALRDDPLRVTRDGCVLLSDLSRAWSFDTEATAPLVERTEVRPRASELEIVAGDVLALGERAHEVVTDAASADGTADQSWSEVARVSMAMRRASPQERPRASECALRFAAIAGETRTSVRAWEEAARASASHRSAIDGALRRGAMDDAVRLALGTRYALESLVGKGGMGQVYAARDLRLQRRVAVKVIIEARDDVEARMRFHREARAVARLHHPNIVPLLDYSGRDAPLPFMVSAFIEGVTLAQLLALEVFTEPAALCVIASVLAALAYVHGARLVHRDVKPDNVFVTDRGSVLLADFGIVRGLDADGGTFAVRATRAVGTPRFSSPEQMFEPSTVGPASDVFSAGSLLYALLSGRSPIEAGSQLDVLSLLRRCEFAPLPASTSRSVSRLVAGMLERVPSRRPSAEEALRDVEGQLAELGIIDPAERLRAFLDTEGSPERRDTLNDATNATNATNDATTSAPSLTRSVTIPIDRPARARRERSGRRRLGTSLGAAAVLGAAVLLGWTLLHSRRPAIFVSAGSPSSADPPASLPALVPPTAIAVPAVPAVPAIPRPDVVRPGPAVLTFVIKPWAKVRIDGEVVGTTPVFQQTSVSAGAHDVRLEHPSFGAKELRVMVGAGETRTIRVDMR
ncbi:MAG: protein kinase [Deltaproteobacteria bacterium]|nr:protein kinase [Deltaproteobacteria bacterium]